MNIKEARIAAGMTQRQAQELIGVPSRTWESWEMGERKPSAWLENTIVKIVLNAEKWRKFDESGKE